MGRATQGDMLDGSVRAIRSQVGYAIGLGAFVLLARKGSAA